MGKLKNTDAGKRIFRKLHLAERHADPPAAGKERGRGGAAHALERADALRVGAHLHQRGGERRGAVVERAEQGVAIPVEPDCGQAFPPVATTSDLARTLSFSQAARNPPGTLSSQETGKSQISRAPSSSSPLRSTFSTDWACRLCG